MSNVNTTNNHFNLKEINRLLSSFIHYSHSIHKMNNSFSPKQRKIRQPNFPSEISENIARIVLQKLFVSKIIWNISVGDLSLEKTNKKIEVKAFSSTGPISFGPQETWDYLCFVDCQNFINKKFSVYLLRLPNTNLHWKNLKINKKQKYVNVCKNGIRPRIQFPRIKKHLKYRLKKVFSGHFSKLK